MAEKCKRDQQIAGVALGGLLSWSVASVAVIGCTPQQRSSVSGTVADQAGEQGTLLRSGVFVDGEHPTSGTARQVERDGATTIELDEAFTTSSSGPDLVVALHRSRDVIGSSTPPAFPIKERDTLVLAPLKSFSGAQSYAVPEGVRVEDYQSAVIWCRRFNATFGAARLDPRS